MRNKRKHEKIKNKSNKISLVIGIILILIGLAVFLYPTISNYLAEQASTEVIRGYNETVSDLDEETVAEELEKAQIYNENLSGDPVHDPFIEGSGYAVPDNYMEVLNIASDDVMAYIDIPKISLYLPIYHGTDEDVLTKGVGHIAQSSVPIGGSSTHCILTGHTGLTTAELFTRIDELVVGDVFYIHVLDQTLAYEVYETTVILPDDISSLTIEEGRDLITLVTCTPYGVNTHRLLVKAERTEYVEEDIQETESIIESLENSVNDNIYIIAIVAGIVIVIIAAFIFVRKK